MPGLFFLNYYFMAIGKMGAIVSQVWGSLGGTTFKRKGSQVQISRHYYLPKQRSQSQAANSVRFRNCVNIFNQLLPAEQESWRNASITGSSNNSVMGCFAKFNIVRQLCGQSIIHVYVAPAFTQPITAGNIYVSLFYQSMLLYCPYPLLPGQYLIVKATKPLSRGCNSRARTFKIIKVLKADFTGVYDLYYDYIQATGANLLPGQVISFQLQAVDVASGFLCKSFNLTSVINNYYDIMFGSGPSLVKLRLTSDHFSNISILDNPAGTGYCYLIAKFTETQYMYVAYGLGKLRLTLNNGLSFINVVPGLSSLNYNDIYAYPDGIGFIWAITPQKAYCTNNFGLSWSEVTFPSPIQINPWIYRLSNNQFLVTAGSSTTGKYIYLTNKSFTQFTLSSLSVNYNSTSSSAIIMPGVIIIGVVASAGNAYILRSVDSGLSFSNVFTIAGSTGAFLFLNINNVSLFAYNFSSKSFLTSSDAGLTWVNRGLFHATAIPRNGIIFSDYSVIVACSSRASIFRSTDLGATWSERYTESGSTSIWSILQLSGSSAVAFSYNSAKVLYTQDSGLTWSNIYTIADNAYVNGSIINNNIKL